MDSDDIEDKLQDLEKSQLVRICTSLLGLICKTKSSKRSISTSQTCQPKCKRSRFIDDKACCSGEEDDSKESDGNLEDTDDNDSEDTLPEAQEYNPNHRAAFSDRDLARRNDLTMQATQFHSDGIFADCLNEGSGQRDQESPPQNPQNQDKIVKNGKHLFYMDNANDKGSTSSDDSESSDSSSESSDSSSKTSDLSSKKSCENKETSNNNGWNDEMQSLEFEQGTIMNNALNNPSQTHTNVTVETNTDDSTGLEGAAGVDGNVASSANSLASYHFTEEVRLYMEMLERHLEDSEEDINSFCDFIK